MYEELLKISNEMCDKYGKSGRIENVRNDYYDILQVMYDTRNITEEEFMMLIMHHVDRYYLEVERLASKR